MKEDAHTRMAQTAEQLKKKLLQRLPESGRIPTAVDGLMLSRKDEANVSESCFYRPTIGVVIQGAKRSLIGNEEHHYD